MSRFTDMSRFTRFSENSFFFLNLKYGRGMDHDAIALNFLKKLDSTDYCSMWVLERLDFKVT